eukprot:TRINITY_DN7977_c0_g1_i1.p1 TRINITY_DN7977_c0_g1~~TRINITY_DN7977_c0_g1_i1.p1  ORF type:complete len:365 (+),score=22.07 TRINITY_DN7977_c0_g1_i1:147-1097(+)
MATLDSTRSLIRSEPTAGSALPIRSPTNTSQPQQPPPPQPQPQSSLISPSIPAPLPVSFPAGGGGPSPGLTPAPVPARLPTQESKSTSPPRHRSIAPPASLPAFRAPSPVVPINQVATPIPPPPVQYANVKSVMCHKCPGLEAEVVHLRGIVQAQADAMRLGSGAVDLSSVVKEKIALERMVEQIKNENVQLLAERIETEEKMAALQRETARLTRLLGNIEINSAIPPVRGGGVVLHPATPPPAPYRKPTVTPAEYSKLAQLQELRFENANRSAALQNLNAPTRLAKDTVQPRVRSTTPRTVQKIKPFCSATPRRP